MIIENGVLKNVSEEDLKFLKYHPKKFWKGITEIGSFAFFETDITTIEIPKTVTAIGDGAFKNCTKLAKIILPNSITQIGPSAFGGCEELTKINIPNGITTINAGTFADCKKLTKIILPDSVTSIGHFAFEYCEKLTKIIIPQSVTDIGEETFQGCEKLAKIVLPNGITSIGSRAFAKCTSLTKTNIPGSVTQMGNDIFEDCEKLAKIDIANGVETIANRTFMGCENLAEMKIPDGVTSIGTEAFAACKNLTKINIPDGVTVIGTRAFYHNPFTEITLPNSVTDIRSEAFAHCKELTKINIPDGITVIGYKTFYRCSSLTEIVIPNSVTSIGSEAFAGCNSLTKIDLPSSVTSIGENAFNTCSNEFELTYDGVQIPSSKLKIFSTNIKFCLYAIKNKKFIPKNKEIIASINENEIENYYQFSKVWKDILTQFINNNEETTDEGVADLFKLSSVLGLFQPEFSKRAKEFLEKHILIKTNDEIHTLFGGFNTRENGFNTEFANFFMSNYREPYTTVEDIGVVKIPFLHLYDEDEAEIINYISAVYNSWSTIKDVYPNKTVLAHREHRSENNNLTEENVLEALHLTIYKNVDEGNEQMHDTVNCYGYTQEEFETLQSWWNEGKQIAPEQMILSTYEDTAEKGITYELLKKDNPLGLIIGEKTNCCQVVNNAGRDCVKYGATKPNSGFIAFYHKNKIVGQAWVWYNKETETVCLDNIEIPTIIEKKMTNKFVDSFIDCLKRLANGIIESMSENCYSVKQVTIGATYNTLKDFFEDFGVIKGSKSPLPADYENSYSDACNIQYIIPPLTLEEGTTV